MKLLVWIGTAMTLGGLAVLALCVIRALRARKAGGDPGLLRERLRPLVALNMVALGLSALGLMTVAVGVILS